MAMITTVWRLFFEVWFERNIQPSMVAVVPETLFRRLSSGSPHKRYTIGLNAKTNSFIQIAATSSTQNLVVGLSRQTSRELRTNPFPTQLAQRECIILSYKMVSN
jgi:hypothetical protein